MKDAELDDYARTRLLVATAVGVVVGLAAFPTGRAAPLIGWDAAALTFCVWTWASVWSMDAAQTSEHALQESPSRGWADVSLLGAALASLIAVGVLLFGASHAAGALKYVDAGFAVASVSLSWVVVHTVYTLKYAHLYYSDVPGGVSFNQDDPPQYTDFAYLAFTLGMTFQVSDTDLQSKVFRRTALQHAWLSFPLGAVIIAASINLVAGLAK
ncbi:MAG: DUF1345 domain-containing protein [Actinomycetota bacterium]|nr:DUF1345 domain-containing protein [Actinomycetota bacterium]